MALRRVHSSAKAVDFAKMLLLNKHLVMHMLPCRVWGYPHDVTVTVS